MNKNTNPTFYTTGDAKEIATGYLENNWHHLHWKSSQDEYWAQEQPDVLFGKTGQNKVPLTNREIQKWVDDIFAFLYPKK